MELKLNGTQMRIIEEIKKKSCYREEISKNLKVSYSLVYRQTKILIQNNLVSEEIDPSDNRAKNLMLTKEGILYLAKIKAKSEVRKSTLSKIDALIEEKFRELGIDCKELLSNGE